MLDKTFDPASFERDLYAAWESSGAFAPREDTQGRDPYVLMMPPPNVTGTLHMGHALTYTLPDILVRMARMQGREVLWQPGMDHAGIATQLVVEKQLAAVGENRRDLGREEFVKRVWAWKEESGGIIANQQRRLGISPHWARERFTLDEGLNKSVRAAFVTLYHRGLLHRAKRLVNWDPKLLTAVSDLEVQNTETKGKYWYIRYAIDGQKDTFITVATSRPETLFGDQAIAVHPSDERYFALHGRYAILPLTGRRIPIVTDEYCDPEKGTGAVKITPAHDFNDFEVGKRHNLEPLNIFDIHACLNENVPKFYKGLDRFEARKKVLEDLEADGLLESTQEVTLMVPICERTGEIVEPYLTDQWFVDTSRVAKRALEAVRNKEVEIVPEQWKATYYHWLENIQPWCVSRQLWWGHRIPAWYGPDGRVFVAHDEAEAKAYAFTHYGEEVTLTQDEDVLDTWFSSALWPFSTLGWPEKTVTLRRYYPTSVLVTGVDILFFWVARMMMMGYCFMDEPPFRTIYLHALVRDEKGQKMSKSKGNIINPLDLIESVGADALRFTLASLSAPGRNINFSNSVVEGYRNFATKIWNAARFCDHYECAYDPDFKAQTLNAPLNKWIVGELASTQANLEDALSRYRFDEACSLVYQFVWGRFCDWYLELAKPLLSQENEAQAETKATAAWVLGQICHLLHPFMPFITEKIWMHQVAEEAPSLITSPWPELGRLQDLAKDSLFPWLIDLITATRSMRQEVGVPAGASVLMGFSALTDAQREFLTTQKDLVLRMTRASDFTLDVAGDARFDKGVITSLVHDVTLHIPVAGLIDLQSERARLEKVMAQAEKDMKPLTSKLENRAFMDKAPADIVAGIQARLEEAQGQMDHARQAIARLDTLG